MENHHVICRQSSLKYPGQNTRKPSRVGMDRLERFSIYLNFFGKIMFSSSKKSISNKTSQIEGSLISVEYLESCSGTIARFKIISHFFQRCVSIYKLTDNCICEQPNS